MSRRAASSKAGASVTAERTLVVKLSELNATFVQATTTGYRTVDSMPEAQGVVFDCPCGTHSVLVWFSGRGVPTTAPLGDKAWDATGTSLDNLSLSPSIDFPRGCWHGFVQHGDVSNAG